MNQIGREVRRLREERGWNQAKLAVEANMAPSAVNQIENGKRNPGATSLEKLARALHVEVADLFPKAQAPLPLEDGGRGDKPEDELAEALLPLVSPWFDLWNDLYERWEAAAKSGALDMATAAEADRTHKDVMAAMNKSLAALQEVGIDPMTGPIGDGLRDAMLRGAPAMKAIADAHLRHLAESPLAQARIGKRRQAEGEEPAPKGASIA